MVQNAVSGTWIVTPRGLKHVLAADPGVAVEEVEGGGHGVVVPPPGGGVK
jgi:hypothetical protein